MVGARSEFPINGALRSRKKPRNRGIGEITPLPDVSLQYSGGTYIAAGTFPSGVYAWFAGDDTYASINSANALTVTPGALTVTADAQSKTYGDSDPTLTYTITSG